MKITFEETVAAENWLTKELLRSLSSEAIDSGRETRSYEVKILINGIEHEPKLLQELISNVEKYIDREALHIFEGKFADQMAEIRKKTDQLNEMIDDAKSQIKEQFNIQED